METQIRQVLEYSQQQEFPYCNKLIEQWQKAKKPLMDAFLDGNLIKEYPKKVTFELTPSAKQQRYQLFIEYVFNLFPDSELATFLDEFVNSEDFYNNSLRRDFILSSGKKIPKGTKVVRSLKHFISDEVLLQDIQSRASELIQENKVTGTLCLSAHPLDFLSSSENTLNWRSCHSLDGQYRSGNLSYMCDSSTLICYLRADNPASIPRFPFSWNNKKWRCLLHVSDNQSMIFAGRQYPFFTSAALDMVRKAFIPATKWLNPFEKEEWSHWHNDYITSVAPYSAHPEDEYQISSDTYFHAEGRIFNLQEIMEESPLSLHYNDVLKSNVYLKPYYLFKKEYFSICDTHFTIGSSVTCPHCGQHLITSPNLMMCAHCAKVIGETQSIECEGCGQLIQEQEVTLVNEMRLCPDCARSGTFICEECGCNDFITNKHYANGLFICEDCWEEQQ